MLPPLRLAEASASVAAIVACQPAVKWLTDPAISSGLTRQQRAACLGVAHGADAGGEAVFYAPAFWLGRFVLGLVAGPVHAPLAPAGTHTPGRPAAARFVLDLTGLALVEARFYAPGNAVVVAHAGNRKEHALFLSAPGAPRAIDVVYETVPLRGTALADWADFRSRFEEIYPTGALTAICVHRPAKPSSASAGAAGPETVAESVEVRRDDRAVERYGIAEAPRAGRRVPRLRRLLPRPPDM